MKQIFSGLTLLWLLALATLAAGSGCVQLPTEKQGITDIRPRISFRATDASMRESKVFVDGLEMGAVADFIEGAAALRLVPGTHEIKITHQGRTIVDERFYAGDGMNRTFVVQGGY